MEIYTFPLLFLSALANVFFNIILVMRLRDNHVNAFEELGRPSAFYFAGVQWMSNPKFFTWLWSSQHKKLQDKKLSQQIYRLRTSWGIFHICFLLLFIHFL